MSETTNPNDAPVNGRNLWLAGLGAAAAVTEQGRKLFDGLVERGRPLAKRQGEIAAQMGDKAAAAVQDAVKLVRETIEHETKAAVKRLDLLTHSDVQQLSARLEALAQRLDEVAAKTAPEPLAEAELESLQTTAKPARSRARAQATKAN
ncbi:MAG TPA: phasin family protein [Thermoanaerobaculia bacterium]